MANHPNRSPGNPAGNPPPAAIIALRERMGLTQTEAAKMLFVSLRTWTQWEYAERRMHPAFWQLFTLKCEMRKET